ncbi:hypothetical protein [Tychonema sp. LEGE 07203]|nr:hypothetical protein [Tychonema sp. LEGE 07203]
MSALKFKYPQRQLFLAIPLTAYNDLFKGDLQLLLWKITSSNYWSMT